MKKKRLLFVAPSMQLGGLENAVNVMAGYFANKNYIAKIITIFRFPHFYKPTNSIEIIDPHFPKKGVPKLWYYLKVVFYLRKKIKQISPDRIVSYGDWSNILVLMAVNGSAIKTFISDRASPALKFPIYMKLLRRILYPKASGIIAQTQRAAQQKIVMLGPMTNILIIPNPIRPIQKHPDIDRKNIVLAVARHYPVKGLDRLIEAFALVKSEDWQIHIAGSAGPSTPLLRQLIEKYRLTEKVILLGGVKEIDKVYQESSIFVLPSRSEGFPNALIEAMAHGLACISFDINAGPSEIIEHFVNGLLVKDGDIKDLAQQIQLLIDDETLRAKLGTEAKKIQEELSLGKIGKMVEEFIFENND